MVSKIALCLAILLMYMIRRTDALVRGETVDHDTLPFRALVSLQTRHWDSTPPNGTLYPWNNLVDHRFCYAGAPREAVGTDWRHFCAGTLVKPKMGRYVVITSAFCVEAFVNDLSNLRVALDSADLIFPEYVCNITLILIHSKYNTIAELGRKKADVALLEVDYDCVYAIDAELKTTVAKLRKKSKDPDADTECEFYGWGDLDCQNDNVEIKGQPRYLQKTNLKIMNKNTCEKMWRELVNENITLHTKELCAIDMDTFSGACKGDSGGALVCAGEVVGIKTWGESEVVDTDTIEGYSKMCSGCKPNVFTRMSGYVKNTNNRKIKLTGSDTSVRYTIP